MLGDDAALVNPGYSVTWSPWNVCANIQMTYVQGLNTG